MTTPLGFVWVASSMAGVVPCSAQSVRGVVRSDRVARVGADPVTKEFAVLQLLLEAQGTVVPAEQLLEKVWDEMADPF